MNRGWIGADNPIVCCVLSWNDGIALINYLQPRSEKENYNEVTSFAYEFQDISHGQQLHKTCHIEICQHNGLRSKVSDTRPKYESFFYCFVERQNEEKT